MKILVIVSEFPKITETFAYRNIVEYDRLGHEPWLFHIKPFRTGEIVHGFFDKMMPRVFTFPYAGARSLGGFAAEWLRSPAKMAKLTGQLICAHWREPKRGLAVAALFPKSVALGRWCRKNGIEHVHGEFAGHPANAAMIAARVADAPFSFTAHANDIFVSQAMLVAKAQQARFVRTISDFNARFLEQLKGFPVARLRVIRCGVSAEIIETPPPEAPDAQGLRILYVGSLVRKKGVTHLLDALAQIPSRIPWTARILGGGDLLEDLKAQARDLGLSKRVTFEGPQPSEAVAAAHRHAHVLVLPSIIGEAGRVEGIPVVLMEAMGNGRVVVASALSGIPELVEDGVTGKLVPAGDDQAIAQALSDIADDWPAAVALAKAGQDRVRAQYLISDNAQMLSAAMQESSE